MAAFAVLVVALLAFSCVADAALVIPKPQAIGFNAAVCPKFPKGGCTEAACALPSAGQLFKFRSIDLKAAIVSKAEINKAAAAEAAAAALVADPNVTVSQGMLKAISVANYNDCCRQCARTIDCSYWQWIPARKGQKCYLLKASVGAKCDKPTATYGTSTEAKQQQVLIGGLCNPSVRDDPHFTGAQGTPFDFSGLPDRSFCLLSDSRIHINILLRGYLDNRTESATVISEGKGVRTWIREVAFIWTVDGVEHKVHMVARSGIEQTRGAGFLSSISVDGETPAVPALGARLSGAGGFSLSLEAHEKTGPFDVDSYSLKIAGLLDMSVRMRVANPLLQSPTDAEAHFNLGINEVQRTDAIHGVLGQTYRKDHAERAAKYSELSALLKAPVVADAVSGKGFLDGEPLKDYMTSNVLTPDCAFATYSIQKDNAVVAAL